MTFSCPVCGFDGLGAPHRDRLGCASFDICPCCGTEFGYDDASRSHADLRRAWRQGGARWRSRSSPPPAGWNPAEQMKRAGFAGE